MNYTAKSKKELAALLGVSMATMRRYLLAIENQLPNYRRSQHLLTPQQVKVFCEWYCIF